MSAGTLTLNNNSASVAGTDTTFTTELAAGDFIVAIVGGIPYTLPVKTVNSNTSATLVSNFTGPTQSGTAWYAVPRVAMNLVTAALVAQSAEALRGLNYDKQNWQSIFSGSGTVTVRLPDGTTYSGPAWGSITGRLDNLSTQVDNLATAMGGKAKSGANNDITSLSGLTTALSILQGGTGSTTATGARNNFGLGSSHDVTFGTLSTSGVLGDGKYALTAKVKGGGYSAWATRGGALLANGETTDVAFSIWKANVPGVNVVAGMDAVLSSSTGAEARMAVGGAGYTYSNTGTAQATAWVSTSDIQFKKNIEKIRNALATVNQMEGCTYDKRQTLEENEDTVYVHEAGLIAQELEEVFPEAVVTMGAEGIKCVNPYPLVALLVNAVNEMSARMDEMGTEIKNLREVS
ncbi:TPA: tail fiber domain-containing protein [Citrobacter freundii]|nr:tail fiber domain-containing protein [Citrobacter freundii]